MSLKWRILTVLSISAVVLAMGIQPAASAGPPQKIEAVGYKVGGVPTCDLSAKSPKKSFRFVGSGWRPNSEVQIVVIYPSGSRHAGESYRWLANGKGVTDPDAHGVVMADANGHFAWKSTWPCYPINKPGQNFSDAKGRYLFLAYQRSGVPTGARPGYFQIVP
jgi:hypothetical protein